MAITLANILFIGLIAENALIVVGIIVYQLYKKMYAYDCGVYIERGNGAVTYHSTRGSKVNRGNVSFLNLFMFKNRDIPFPNNDAILIGNKGGRMEIFLDSNGSAHQLIPPTTVSKNPILSPITLIACWLHAIDNEL